MLAPDTPHSKPLPIQSALRLTMPLDFSFGHYSHKGKRPRNEDYFGIATPDEDQRAVKGAVFAIADGVGGSAGGREAAEATVRSTLSDYYATPETWAVPTALDRVLSAINRWLLGQGATHAAGGFATTLSLLVLRGRRAYLAHVGDTRIYRLRDQRLEQLTADHVWETPGMNHVLKRAVGLDEHLAIDFTETGLAESDTFLLVSDGVWQVLGDKRMHELLYLHQSPSQACKALVDEAIAKGGQDNATAVAVRVETLPPEALMESLLSARHLPVPARLKPGRQLDGFEILELLHESRTSLLYKVKDVGGQQVLALKTLQPMLADDTPSCDALLAEEWLGKRLVAHYFPQVIPVPPERRNFLYYVMSYHEGATLEALLRNGLHFTVPDTVQIGIRLMKALGALHRLEIVHRDIKPANIHKSDDGKLRILDLGVAFSTALPERPSNNPGTPSFMAPERFSGASATPQSDLYAAGVTLYQLLTRRFPYGEIEPFQRPRFGEPIPPTRYRPDIPQWLETVLLKAVAREPSERFETSEEFLIALERGDSSPLRPRAPRPLLKRDPLLLWQGVALVSIILNLLLIYNVLVGR